MMSLIHRESSIYPIAVHLGNEAYSNILKLAPLLRSVEYTFGRVLEHFILLQKVVTMASQCNKHWAPSCL